MDYESAAETKASGSRKPFLEGNIDGKFLVTKAEEVNGFTGNKYIVELRTLEAKAVEAGATVPATGSERVVIIDLDSELYGFKNLMAFVEGLNGGPLTGADKAEKGAKLRRLLGVRAVDAEEARKKGIGTVAAQEAFAVGMVVGNRTNVGKTKKGGDFTYHNWYTLQQTLEQVAARKAAIKEGREVTLASDNAAA